MSIKETELTIVLQLNAFLISFVAPVYADELKAEAIVVMERHRVTNDLNIKDQLYGLLGSPSSQVTMYGSPGVPLPE